MLSFHPQLHRRSPPPPPHGDAARPLDETPERRRRRPASEKHAYALRHGITGARDGDNLLVGLYARSGFLSSARKVLDLMPGHDTSAAWIPVLAATSPERVMAPLGDMLRDNAAAVDARALTVALGRATVNQGIQMHALAVKLQQEKDAFVGCAVVGMYARGRMLGEARSAFDRIKKRDAACYNSLLSSYGHGGALQSAVGLFVDMIVAGAEPTESTMVALLSSCAGSAFAAPAEQCHAQAVLRGFSSRAELQGVIIDMYAKCGNLAAACHAFDRTTDTDNVVVWNSIIGGYGKHGRATEAIEIFRWMTEVTAVRPDHVTFTHLLSACSHAGLVDDACRLFYSMEGTYGVAARDEHYRCIVDLFARAGMVSAAYEFILASGRRLGPSVWTALLSACRSHKNNADDIAAIAQKQMLNLAAECSGGYVAASGALAAGHQWDEAAAVRALMDKRGVVKDAGRSVVDIGGGEVHAFKAGAGAAEVRRACRSLNASIATDWTQLRQHLTAFEI